MPIFDFNQNMYQFRRDGFCADPNVAIKGFVFEGARKGEDGQKLADAGEEQLQRFVQENN